MEILNVGLPELLIILVLMFVLLGPKEMVRTAGRVGRWVRSVIKSPMWREVMGYSQEIRELPQKIMEDSGLKETLEEVRKDTQAATDEINAQIKEVKEAARVKEAEHLRVEFNAPAETNKIAPPAAKAAEEPVDAESVAEPTAESAQDEPAAAEQTAESTPAKTPAAAPAAGGSISAAIAAAAAAAKAKAETNAVEKAKKPRAVKKAASMPEVEAPSAELPSAELLPAETPPAELPKTEAATAVETTIVEGALPVEEKPVKPRKPRRKKTEEPPAAVVNEAPAVVPVTLEESARQEVAARQESVAQQETSAQQEAAEPQEASVPEETPAVVPVAETPRKTRSRKPKQAETASLGGAQVYPDSTTETAAPEAAKRNGNGTGAEHGAESRAEDAPAKRQRKPRAQKHPTPDNGTGQVSEPGENPTAEEQSYRDAA